MNVLFVVSECVPFAKSGGLADVAGSLPKELKRLGHEVRVLLPKYGTIPTHFFNKAKKIAEFEVQLSWRRQYCGIFEVEHDGVIYYFMDNEYYFHRPKLYEQFDDGERFAYFCKAAVETLYHIPFLPDVIHTHDWHTGMIPFLLKTQHQNTKLANIKNIFTIHNLQFQGIYGKSFLGDVLGIHYDYFNQLEFGGNVNFMKSALVYADVITTVSPTYKEEIKTDYYGERLNGLLQSRDSDLYGIVNGIDNDLYNPEKDDAIASEFSVNKLEGKKANKRFLQEYFNLPVDDSKPLIAVVSRLTSQKGFDLVRAVFHEILQEDIQMIMLGTGDPQFEHFFGYTSQWYQDKLKVHIGFNEDLAHQIYAGADLFLMPSKFEPCGLSQLIAMRYGTLPIVRETGGLRDTVQPYNEFTGDGNGFSFTNFNAHDMLYTIRRALSFYHNPSEWKKIVRNSMKKDYSWARSASEYEVLYKDLIERI